MSGFKLQFKKYLLVAGLVLASALVRALPAAPVAPFVIAPMFEGVGYCAAGAGSPNLTAAYAACVRAKNPSGPLLQAALDRLEPGGATGKVQVGYTVGVNLLGYSPSELSAHLNQLRELIETTRRPMVLHLMGNQFASPSSQRTLAPSSYAAFSDQSIPKEQYFVTSIQAWTLATDPGLEVNRLRFGALQQVGRWYAALPLRVKDRVVGITLAGELHHFFPDFANGMGRYEDIKVTDYSPGSVLAFQAWLRSRFASLGAFNQQMGTVFSRFDVISPPARNIRGGKLDAFSQHFDAYAHGLLPIEGWLTELPPNHKIHIYLNGKVVGEAEYGLSRQDVYEALAEVTDARVGFRYWLDFSRLPRGIHTIQVVVSGGAQRWQIAQRKIVLMGSSQDKPSSFAGEIALTTEPPKVRFWLDQPRNMQDYYFNPLAKAWSEFRSDQVTMAYREWFERAVAGGLPWDKLYSHQIAVAAVGSWNPLLTASDASLSGVQPYKKGINLYGGALDVALLRRHYVRPNEAFAVPEFHTQAWKNPKAPGRVLQEFKAAGATFVSPYFMSIVPAKFRGEVNPHDRFRIAPENPSYGSNHFYEAIVEAARE
ncbi:MAG: hypothetical protein Q8K22_15000 [Rhodoferax sp.]|nr:hypothetical protein [Rhodoferax sp.]